MTQEEVVAMEVEAPVVEKKKKKKSKKVTAAEPEVAQVESSKRKAEDEHEDAPPKKKKKKSKTAEEEPAAMEVEVEEPEKKKKKKKKSKTTEEEAAAPAEEEAPAAEEGEKKKKKKKKSKDAEEEKAEEPVEEKAEEAAEEKEAEEKAEEPAEEGKKEILSVFIGGLPWSADEETVKKDFGECGEITGFRMLMDRETGRPKGTAFCDFATTEAVKKALEFNETEYGGRTIYVREVNDDGKGKGKKGKKGDGKKGKGKKGGKGPSEKPDGCKSLIVKSLSYETTEESLWTLFEGMNVERVKLLTDRETGSSKGIAFVDFADEAGVDEGIKKSNTELDGRYIFIDYSGGKGEGKGKDGKKGDGKKGKGKKGKGKKGGKSDPVRSANAGAIAEFQGTTKSFDSDSD